MLRLWRWAPPGNRPGNMRHRLRHAPRQPLTLLKDLVGGLVRDEAHPVLVPVATQASTERTKPARLGAIVFSICNSGH